MKALFVILLLAAYTNQTQASTLSKEFDQRLTLAQEKEKHEKQMITDSLVENQKIINRTKLQNLETLAIKLNATLEKVTNSKATAVERAESTAIDNKSYYLGLSSDQICNAFIVLSSFDIKKGNAYVSCINSQGTNKRMTFALEI